MGGINEKESHVLYQPLHFSLSLIQLFTYDLAKKDPRLEFSVKILEGEYVNESFMGEAEFEGSCTFH